MLTHPTLDQLKALKLDGMADAFVELQAQDSSDDLDHAEWLALLIDRETVNRNTRRFQTRMRTARLRHVGADLKRKTLVCIVRFCQDRHPLNRKLRRLSSY